MSIDNRNKLIPAERTKAGPLAQVARDGDAGYGYGYGYGGATEETGGFRISEYIRILYKNKWLIATLCIVTTTVVAVAAYKVQDEYVATATVLVGDENPNVLPNAQPMYVYDFDGKRFRTRLRLLQMPDLIRQAVIEMDLRNNPNVFSDKPSDLQGAFSSLFRARQVVHPQPPTASTLGAPLDPA